MSDQLEGGCLCGAVRYTIEGQAAFTAVCHCRNCQKQGGSAFSVNLVVQSPQMKVDGDLKTYTDTGETGNEVLRQFCANCGSPIISVLTAMPGTLAVKAGTLDDTSAVKPQAQLWCASNQDWVSLKSDMPAFDKNMPSA